MFYSKKNAVLAKKAVTLLKEKGFKVSTAESCTGGLLSSYFTAVSGASSVFEFGVASYSANAKEQLLGVNPKTIETLGTVSAKTAEEMADGIRNLADADIGISVTGVAGPDIVENKAVGTVYSAFSHKGGVFSIKLEINEQDRQSIRQEACFRILTALIECFERGTF